jgi:glucuronate isomerase
LIDDTRAFCTIPARQEMSPRLHAGYVTQFVPKGGLDEDEAYDTMTDVVSGNPRRAFKR